jgi:tRNA U34 2-thiouridine synthase MnmA/TrmU
MCLRWVSGEPDASNVVLIGSLDESGQEVGIFHDRLVYHENGSIVELDGGAIGKPEGVVLYTGKKITGVPARNARIGG